MIEIENYGRDLENLSRQDKTTIGLIAKYFIKNLKSSDNLPEANVIAREIGVSNAMISKFCKKLGYRNIYEMNFIQKLFKQEVNLFKKDIKKDDKSCQAAYMINNARKIFLVGVSNGYSVNLDFARKINRLDLWTYVSDNKYEQIGLSRILTNKDVLVVNSVSLQHLWMIDIIKKTRAQVILVSSFIPKSIAKKVNIYFKISSTTKDTVHRNITFSSRNDSFDILDNIFINIMQIEGNDILLEATRYNK